MANTQRGEVALTVEDRTYRLVLDLDAICQLEAALSTPERIVTLPDVLAAMLRLSHTHIRAFVWAGLRRHHPDVSLVAAGELIDTLGGVDAMLAQLETLQASTQPDTEDRPTVARPQTARRPRGTGGPVTSTRDGSA